MGKVNRKMSVVTDKNVFEEIRAELQKGMSLKKCRKCGCMKGALESLRSVNSSVLVEDIKNWLNQMEPTEYNCLGCDHCFPAAAMNIFNEAFPEELEIQSSCCNSEAPKRTWPPAPGKYSVLYSDSICSVAASTLASVELAEVLAKRKPDGLCIVGKTETENIGIDKVIQNTISNPSIRFLLLAGKESKGHFTGGTFLALHENGVDENMRVTGSPGKRPVLKNVTKDDVATFRNQVQLVDMIGCDDVEAIVEKIEELVKNAICSRDRQLCNEEIEMIPASTVPVIQAEEPTKVDMDPSGYFVIIPQPEREVITVEHYSYDNKLQHVVEGKDARSLYSTIVENVWVTELGHAAYLGKELAKAELSIQLGLKYVQDGA